MKVKTREEAKAYVKATILTGNSKRIREVLNRYNKKYVHFKNSEERTYDTAKEIFKDLT